MREINLPGDAEMGSQNRAAGVTCCIRSICSGGRKGPDWRETDQARISYGKIDDARQERNPPFMGSSPMALI